LNREKVNNPTRERTRQQPFRKQRKEEAEVEERKWRRGSGREEVEERKWKRGSGGEEVGWCSCAIPTGTG